MPKMLRLAALLAALVVVFAGCGGSSGKAGSTANGGSASTGESGSTQEIVDPSGLKVGGSATVAAAQGIGQLDPYKILYSFESVAHRLLYSSLTQYTLKGENAVQPDLAESWTSSKDLRTWTFKLRAGMKMSNGQPLDASVVAASLKRAFDPKTVFLWTVFLPKAKSIEAVDATTVRIALAGPAGSFPEAMTKVPIEDVATLKQIDRDPVATGAYKVASFVPDQNLVLVPNEHYYGTRPKLDRLTITKAQDNTAAYASLQAGEIQSLWSIPWTAVRQIDGGDSTNVVVTTGKAPVQNIMLMTDNKHGVFANVKARQALAYATDRAAILKAVYAGRGIVAKNNDPIPAWSKLFKRDLPAYDFDLAKAKQMFAQAGVGPGTKLTFWGPAGQYQEWSAMGEVLQSDLKKIGISLNIETNELSQFAARFAPAGKSWPNLIVPNAYGGLPEPLIPDWYAPGVCECNFDNVAYNKALADAQAAPDKTAFSEAIGRTQEVFNAQSPVTVVLQTAVPVATVSKLKNVWIDPTGDARYDDAGYAK
jgi:peptide/nickel transport system substrate-binding protein